MKRDKNDPKKKTIKINKQIMKGVIRNLRDLKIDCSKEIDEEEQDEDKSSGKNSRSITSILLKSHDNRSLIGSAKEKWREKQYKKHKARILNQSYKSQRENLNFNTSNNKSIIEDEIMLGKRASLKFKKEVHIHLINKSSESSLHSQTSELLTNTPADLQDPNCQRQSSDNPTHSIQTQLPFSRSTQLQENQPNFMNEEKSFYNNHL